MYTRRIFVGVILTTIFVHSATGLIKLWAARHSTHDGVDGTVAKAAQVVL